MKLLTTDYILTTMISLFTAGLLIVFGVILRNGAKYFLKTFKIITDNLAKDMNKLSEAFKEERKERIKNQNEIAGIKSEVDSVTKRTDKMENRFNEHIVGDHK